MQFDDSLCRLVDRLGCEGRLEVEFQAVRDAKLDFDKYIPKFAEKGRVRVVDEADKSVIYCSDGAR